MSVPPRLIGFAAEILSEYYSHSRIDSRFMMCGYPGKPPEGNKSAKISAWLSTANQKLEHPIDNFFELIEEFMEDENTEQAVSSYGGKMTVGEAQEKFRQIFQKCDLTYPRSSSPIQTVSSTPTPMIPIPQKEPSQMKQGANEKVFIVHGHNEAMKEKTARLVTALGLEPIILSEQPNGGKTIIEKFEANAQVGFAVIIMSADDLGGTSPSDLKKRARQNVILELGYFIGALKRNNVCVLKEEGVEEPSDILGIVYHPLDSGGAWRYNLASELQHAGFKVDKNKIK